MNETEIALNQKISPLIICGGAGTRLWPASREGRPKQFLSLTGARSTFQDTVLRLSDAALFDRPIVITNTAHRFLVQEQLAELGAAADIILEPMRRDSGPAMAAGAAFAQRRDRDAIVLAINADQAVRDNNVFITACRHGVSAARAGYIVTFGAKSEWPATEYAYIRPGEVISGEVRTVSTFIEKPNAANATDYVRAGYLWNTGNYMFLASVLLDHYFKFNPSNFHAISEAVAKSQRDVGFVMLEPKEFSSVKSTSIDYAVMQRTSCAAVVPVSCGWSDVGSWRAVWELSEKDPQGNAAHGRVVLEDARNCNVVTDEALVALEGVDDLTVVATPDAILVSRQNDGNGLKRLVAKLKLLAPRVTEEHLKMHRPWGSYQSVDNGERHQVKRIVVKPGQRLSRQRHYRRSEHWIVVRGAARVTINDLVKTVHENESIYIPIGAVHRLENPGKIMLELIEVQTGSHVGEDDIVEYDHWPS